MLLSKVSFERNYDNFYPDNERIYRIETQVISNDEPSEFGSVSGAIAPGMKAEVPGVEAATRYTGITYDNAVFYTADKKRYKGSFIMADEYFFDVLPRPMITGNAGEILSRSMYALVSQSLAKRIGGDAVGKVIQLEAYPGREITIGGIFKDLPENSHIRYDAIVSLESIGKFAWDGRNNWVGNDRYRAFVKLQKGVDPESLAPAIRKMQEKNQPLEEIRKHGTELFYGLVPLTSLYSGSESVKNVTLVLSIIAIALLLTTVLNYLLIVITALVQRSKEVAVKKCYGASGWNIVKLISAETLLHFVLGLSFSLFLLFVFQDTIKEILGASLMALFSGKTLVLLGAVCVAIFAVSVIVPANTLQRIPLATVFRQNKRMRQQWKLALLFVQFASVAFLFTLTASVSKQYNFMVNDPPGYDYKNVAYFDLAGADSISKKRLETALMQLPEIELVSLASELPFDGKPGNNVFVEGDDRDLFNIADFYYADEHYIPLLNIPIISGKNFSSDNGSRIALVSESFRQRMKTMLGWDDVVGRDVIVTEHGLTRIVGVFPDIRISSLDNQDTRPAVLFHTAGDPTSANRLATFLMVKLKTFNGENIGTINKVAAQILPEREMTLIPYADSIVKSYDEQRLFRNAILFGTLITLVIALIGLIGYINNEISFRTAEIAIRKINGATLNDILGLFGRGIFYIALPAVVAGCIATHFASGKWMENFSEKAGFGIGEYILCAVVLLVLIEAVVVINCIRTANRNPVESLKSD